MRGTVLDLGDQAARPGITPADAGNSDLVSSGCALNADHPRGCGEQSLFAKPRLQTDGSPPRMRGTALPDKKAYTPFGITPADAGNSAAHSKPEAVGADHPRGCGEQ